MSDETEIAATEPVVTETADTAPVDGGDVEGDADGDADGDEALDTRAVE